ncbi:MAG: AAA family ATPase, partial [Methylomarinum sp.]|nr:AAA family ATPase [Methylomarinum sp.]
MRPLHLSIRAFGPYAEQQVFDFQLLGERNLFLITGDIGAGKTTVFDAICCALYGETSGGERTVEDMRSHHAQPETSTEITLDFSIQGALYRACFSPRQQIPKKRGEGFTEQSVQSALYQIDFVEQSNEQATLLSESIRNTRPEVEALIGFNVNQFRQVVMLAQGKFRELLTANSSDREEILKTLVDTEFLSRFERKLKTLEAELKQKVTELESQIKGLLKTENVDSIEDLRPQQLEIKQQQSQVDKEIVVAESTRLKAENDLNQAIAMNKLFVLHQSLLLAQQNLLAQKATFDTLALSLETHTKAEKLWPDYRLYEDANKALCLLNVTLKQAKETLTNCSQLATKTADELKYMEADEKVQQQRKLELHELKQTNEALALLSVNRIKHQQTVDLFSRSEQLVLHAEKKLKTDLQQLESNDIALNKLSHCETQSLETEHLLLQNKQLLKQLNRIKETEKKQIKIEAIANKLQQQFIQQNAVVESVEQSLQQLESDRLQDMASHLAIQLKHDAPCSVCGSDHHPAPATPPPHIPSNQQIDDSKQQLKIEQQKRLELQQQSDEQHCLLAGTLSALVELRHSLSTETASIDSCIKQSTTLEQQLESINIQLKQKQALQQDQNKLRLSLKQADDDRGNLQSQLKEHHSEMIGLEGQIKSQLNNIPTQFQNKTELNQDINLLAQQLAEFDSQFQALSVKNKSAQQQLNTAIGTLSSLEIQ